MTIHIESVDAAADEITKTALLRPLLHAQATIGAWEGGAVKDAIGQPGRVGWTLGQTLAAACVMDALRAGDVAAASVQLQATPHADRHLSLARQR